MTREAVAAWLDWYAQMGVRDAFGSWPTTSKRAVVAAEGLPKATTRRPPADSARNEDRPASFDAAPSGRPSGGPVSPLLTRSPVAGHARAIAEACSTLDELAEATAAFDGCALRHTATQCCFSDGNPGSSLMLIGEAPGAEEDRQGKPFVGQSGQLLDRMMATIGLNRTQFYITNAIFWRPPGNRTPTPAEIATCQPFLERQIALIQPRMIVFVGGIAAKALLGVSEGVTKLRGRHFPYHNGDQSDAIRSFVMFHPAHLLRQPLQKRLAWRDLLTLRQSLAELERGEP